MDLQRVSDVTYEIRLRDDDKLVYGRSGLVEAWHRIEEPLQPNTTYRWAIRAWFKVDGVQRVSEWSQLLYRGNNKIAYTAGWRGFPIKTPDGG